MANKKVEGEPPPALDSGKAWLVVAAAFFLLGASTGYMSCISVFLVHWRKEFNATATEVGWVGVILGLLSPVSGTIAGGLTSRFGCRVTVLLSCLFFSGPLVLIGLSAKLWHIYLSTVLVAAGCGFSYQAAVTAVGHNFQMHVAKANGIAFAGAGAGVIAIPPFCEFLTKRYSWNGAYFILAAVMLIIIICGLIMRPTERELFLLKKRTKDPVSENFDPLVDGKNIETANNFSVCSIICKPLKSVAKFFGISMLWRTYHVLFIAIAFGCLGFGYYASVVYLVLRVEEELHVDTQEASFAVSAVGVGSFVGRLSNGFIVDLKIISPMALHCLSSFVCAVCAFLIPLIFNYWVVIFLCFVFGATSGMSVALTPVTLREVVKPKEFSSSFGITMAFFGIGNCVGVFLLGFLFDVTESFKVSYFTAGSVLLLGMLSMGTEWFLQRRIKRQLLKVTEDSNNKGGSNNNNMQQVSEVNEETDSAMATTSQ